MPVMGDESGSLRNRNAAPVFEDAVQYCYPDLGVQRDTVVGEIEGFLSYGLGIG